MKPDEIKKLVQEEIKTQLKGSLFAARKLTDNPTDNLQVTNRRFVTLNGTTAQRPVGSVMGQHYFDTSLATNGQLIIWNGTGWVNGSGTYV